MRIPRNIHNTNEELDAGHTHAINESPYIAALFRTPEQVKRDKQRQIRVLKEAGMLLEWLGHAGRDVGVLCSTLWRLVDLLETEARDAQGR